MWKCSYCDKTTDESPGWRRKRPEPYGKCPKCGFTLGRSKATTEKLNLLRDICNVNNYDLFIDACAGSGQVQLYKGDIIDGSSLLFEEIAQKEKPPAKLVSIECDPKTFKLLEKFFEGSETHLIRGDCNEHIMEFATGEVRTLVFIDPFGWGVPAIDRNKVIKISQTPNTDLLFNFTYRISREMGYVRNNLESSIERNRKTANTWKKALHTFWGTLDWLDKWGSMNAIEWAEKYASPFRKNNKVRIYRIPVHGKLIYHLIFATKFDIPPYGIEKFFSKNRSSLNSRARNGLMRMNHLCYEVNAESNDTIEVTLDKPANVRVMDPHNYQNYRNGRIHSYHGGHIKKSPFHIRPPHKGHWYVVIDLGGYAGSVRASVNVLRGK